MESVYRVLGKSRQQFYQQLQRDAKRKQSEAIIIDQVKDWRVHHTKMGSRTLYYSMKEAGITLGIGVTRFEQLLMRYGFTVPKIRRFVPKTSDGKGKRAYPNLTNGLMLTNINELIVGDITYFWVESKWHYIFTLKDVYSQHILSLNPSRTLEASNAVCSLLEAARIRGEPNLRGAIHHSDNGSQYESDDYKELISRLRISISRAEDCKQNGSAEQLNHIAKNMYLNQWSIKNFYELKQACKEVQYLSNHQRAIKQLGYKTPIGFEKYIRSLPDKSRPRKTLFDFNQI